MAGGPIGQVSDMGDTKLLKTVERWLRTERDTIREADSNDTSLSKSSTAVEAHGTDTQQKTASKPAPYFPSRHMAYFH